MRDLAGERDRRRCACPTRAVARRCPGRCSTLSAAGPAPSPPGPPRDSRRCRSCRWSPLSSVALSSAPDGVKAWCGWRGAGRVPALGVVLPDERARVAGDVAGVAQTRAADDWSSATVPQPVFTSADVMSQPGAMRSGLRRPSAVGPWLPSPKFISFGSRLGGGDADGVLAPCRAGRWSSPVLPADPRTRWSSLFQVKRVDVARHAGCTSRLVGSCRASCWCGCAAPSAAAACR